MDEFIMLMKSVPWTTAGIAFVAVNVLMLFLKLTKKLIMLGIGAILIAIGLYTGIIPDILLAIPVWF